MSAMAAWSFRMMLMARVKTTREAGVTCPASPPTRRVMVGNSRRKTILRFKQKRFIRKTIMILRVMAWARAPMGKTWSHRYCPERARRAMNELSKYPRKAKRTICRSTCRSRAVKISRASRRALSKKHRTITPYRLNSRSVDQIPTRSRQSRLRFLIHKIDLFLSFSTH